MLKNYFKTAFRNLVKNKAYAFISIFGLAIGMAVCILLLLYVKYELSYDRFNLLTANATTRAKEIAIRKVAGASRYDLAMQFIGESRGGN